MLGVAFVGPLAASYLGRVRELLTVPCDITVFEETACIPHLANPDVLVSMSFTSAMGRVVNHLKMLQVPGAGLDKIDRSALPAGVMLANVYGHETGIAEYVFGAMLALGREFARLDADLRNGIWDSQFVPGRAPPPPWRELAGKKLGILGHGRIGRAVSRRATAFEMKVCAFRRNPGRSVEGGIELVGGEGALDDLLACSDYLVVTLPLTDATRGIVGARELSLMKPTSLLINVARGELVDEGALFDALRKRQITAAALDVWYRYPSDSGRVLPSTYAFHQLSNVLMTPHISAWTDGMFESRAKLIAENIVRIAEGKIPLNLVA